MKSFPAKILLFGEYSILEGSMAMAVPYPTYSGHLVFYDTVPDNQVRESGIQLLKFCTFLKDRIDRFPFLDLDRFEEEINQGLSFNSNIHQGYGLGSSGALTAAVYERYCTKDPTLPVSDLRSRLASMESYFHGTSSGLDPLVSFTGEPVLIGKDGKVTLIKGNEWKVLIKETKAFLADTGTIGKTEGFVNWFKAQMQDINYAYTINQRYIPAVNLAIESLMKGHTVTFKKAVNTVSQLQRTLFLPMIPEPFHPYFEDGVTKKEFFLKLCGSGGGGFMLGFATEETEGKLMKYEFPTEPIFLFADKGSNTNF